MTLQQLADEYKISPRTLRRWILPKRTSIYGQQHNHITKRMLLTPTQIANIRALIENKY